MKVFGLNTNFQEFGCGNNTVLFLHGWGSDVSDFLGSAKMLSKNMKTICLDLWGFGKSETPKQVLSSFDYANFVFEFLKQKNLESCHLVGHSFGGKIATIFCNNHKNFAKSLILVASAGIVKKSFKTKLLIAKYKHLKNLVKQGKKPQSVLQKFGSSDWQGSCDIMKQIMAKVTNENLENEFKKVTQNTMIVWGKQDKTTPLFMAKKIHKYIKNSELKIFKGEHFVHIQNFLKFNQTCLKFWEELC